MTSFVMEKNKRYSYDGAYKLKVIAYAEEHGNRAAERHFGPPPTENVIRYCHISTLTDLALETDDRARENGGYLI